MSEDKKEKTGRKGSTFYFLKGVAPGIIFDPKNNTVLIRSDGGFFKTKSKKIADILTSKGYEEVSVKRLRQLKKVSKKILKKR